MLCHVLDRLEAAEVDGSLRGGRRRGGKSRGGHSEKHERDTAREEECSVPAALDELAEDGGSRRAADEEREREERDRRRHRLRCELGSACLERRVAEGEARSEQHGRGDDSLPVRHHEYEEVRAAHEQRSGQDHAVLAEARRDAPEQATRHEQAQAVEDQDEPDLVQAQPVLVVEQRPEVAEAAEECCPLDEHDRVDNCCLPIAQ